MKKKKILVGALLATAIFSLAACTKDNGSKTPASSTPAQSTPASTTPSTPAPSTPVSTPAPTTPSTPVPSTPAPTTPSTPAPTTPSTPAPTTPSTTVPTTVIEQKNPIEMNGTAYDTIAAAIAAIPSGDTGTYTIRLNKGVYNENGLAYNGSATIKIAGNTNAKYGADVVIKGHGSVMPGEQGSNTKSRCLISIQGTGNLILENLTLESDWYRADHAGDVQAEVLGTDTTGNTAAYNCGFKSHQDTIRTAGKAWFYGCYVEGDVDFLWMESGGKVALYEECEIVSVYDSAAKTHNTYITAPRMAESVKVGKGLVIYNSVVRESDEAKENGQKTYLARTPWSSGYYNQVSYINTTCSDIELTDGPWYKNQIETIYEKTTVGWKMDQFTADSIGIEGEKDYIVDDATVKAEYNGRKSIINRFYDTGKLRYVTDGASNWDVDTLIAENGWVVTEDTSSDKLPNETMGESVVYKFDGTEDQSTLCSGFELESGKPHYRGQAGATITIPVTGKCYVEVYGYYAGTMSATTDGQGEAIMFFNNGSTSSEVENDYIVYNQDATSVVLTAQATTYITKIVVVSDSAIEYKEVEDLTISKSSPLEIVGVPVTLTASISPKGVTNSSVKWSSSNTEVATIDEYTGKVKFLTAGEVTFTATACDGSGVEKSITCNPTSPTWTEIEWYTTDTDITVEEGAEGLDMFDVNSSAYKSLSNTYTFTNLAGEEISSNRGFKLNSAGKLSFATLQYAEVTLIVAPQQNSNVTAPQITTAEGATAELLSTSVDEATGLQTFTYALLDTGLWNIERSDPTMENNPLLYVKVEYKTPVISEETGITFKGGSYTVNNTGVDTVVSSGYVDAAERTVQINKINITNCVSNDTAGTNWLKFNAKDSAKIELNVGKACTLVVAYYSQEQSVKFEGEALEGTLNKSTGLYEYEIPSEGLITIEAVKNDYIGFVGVMLKTLDERKADACAKLELAYPAKNYTQNADYATVLQAQKDAINAAADEAAVATAYAEAVVAMDALEIDKAEEDTTPYIEGSLTVSFKDDAANEADNYLVYDDSAIEGSLAIGKFTLVDNGQGVVANNGDWLKFNTGGKVTFEIATSATLTISFYQDNNNVTVTVDGVVVTVNEDGTYTLPAGKVVVEAIANGYLGKVTVDAGYLLTESATVSFKDDVANEADNYLVYDDSAIDGSLVIGKFTLVDNGQGVVANNGDWLKFNTGGKVVFNTLRKSTLAISFYQDSNNVTVTVDGVEVTVNEDGTYTLPAGSVVIEAIANGYLGKVSVDVQKVLEESATVSFKDDVANEADNYLVYDDSAIDGSLEIGAFKLVDNGQGVVANNGDWLKFNAGGKVLFNTEAKSTLTISFYQDNNNVTVTVNGVEIAVNADGTYTLPAGEVVIEAIANGYLGKVTVDVEKVLKESTKVSFKDDVANEADNYLVYDDSAIDGSLEIGAFKLVDNGQGVVANNGDWLKFNAGGKVVFATNAESTLTISFYQDNNNVTVTVDGVEVTANEDGTYTLPAGSVVIEAIANGYLGSVEVVYA